MILENVSKKMDELVGSIIECFEDPLDEQDTEALAILFKIKLNHASGNLTEKEAVQAVANINSRSNVVLCMFTSEWSDGTVITTPGTYDTVTGEVTPEVSDSTPSQDATLEEEYIDVVIDGESRRRTVCPECHEYLLVTDSEDHCGHTYYYTKCPECGYEK